MAEPRRRLLTAPPPVLGFAALMPERFELTKWYLDCVTPDATALIAYLALLHWRDLTFHYGSVLLSRPEQPVRTWTSLRATPLPALSGSELRVGVRALGLVGSWTARSAPLRRTVLDGPDGAIDWYVLQPLGRVSVRHRGTSYEGLGYAEVLTMNIAPWRLPIEELRWGRALFEGEAFVWIDWRGAHRFRTVVRNGVELEPASIDERGLVAGAVTLELSAPRSLRQGKLLHTALARVPGVRQLFPERGLLIDERKWLSRAHLHGPSGSREDGFAIHEIVRWA